MKIILPAYHLCICVYARPGIIILIVFIENGGRGAPVPPTAQLPAAACRQHTQLSSAPPSSRPALSPLNHFPLTATHALPPPPWRARRSWRAIRARVGTCLPPHSFYYCSSAEPTYRLTTHDESWQSRIITTTAMGCVHCGARARRTLPPAPSGAPLAARARLATIETG